MIKNEINGPTIDNWQASKTRIGFSECNPEEQQPRMRKHQSKVQQQQRNQRHKQRSRTTKYDVLDDYVAEDTEDDNVLLPKWKLFLVGAAIFMCFSLLYPSVFSPVLASLFGTRREQTDNNRNIHPSMLSGGGQREHRPGRPIHPHPAAVPQSQQSTGGSRGGFSWLLPFYTIGVVCFLLYTLFKIMFKKNTKRKRKTNGISNWMNEEENESEDDLGIGSKGARGRRYYMVQARLRKTERAMQEILQQLEFLATQSQQPLQQSNLLNQPEQASENEKPMTIESDETAAHESEKRENNFIENPNEEVIFQHQLEMQKSLDELKILSKICKRDHRLKQILRQKNSSSTEDEEKNFDSEDDELFDDKEESPVDLNTSEEDDDNYFVNKVQNQE